MFKTARTHSHVTKIHLVVPHRQFLNKVVAAFLFINKCTLDSRFVLSFSFGKSKSHYR